MMITMTIMMIKINDEGRSDNDHNDALMVSESWYNNIFLH